MYLELLIKLQPIIFTETALLKSELRGSKNRNPAAPLIKC